VHEVPITVTSAQSFPCGADAPVPVVLVVPDVVLPPLPPLPPLPALPVCSWVFPPQAAASSTSPSAIIRLIVDLR
jgi:hypothetical protein